MMPIFIIIIIAIKVDTFGPVIFKQKRVGRYGELFFLYKFRTMVLNSENMGPSITAFNDVRVTRTGDFLRYYKLDELPQFINVLQGTMSLVGPRPEIEKYVLEYSEEYKEILLCLPGMTDYASIEYRDESELLHNQENPEEYYLKNILPKKLILNKEYMKNQCFLEDMKILYKTLFCIFFKN